MKKKLKVLVTGDRHWANPTAIERELKKLRGDVTIIHGKARGADSFADTIGNGLGYTVRGYKADWDKYGKAAGPIRNQYMLDKEHFIATIDGHSIDLVLAFHKDLTKSKGTKDMVQRAKKAGIKVKVFKC